MGNETFMFTIKQFCESHGFSRASLYNLWNEGRGPKTVRVGRRVMITAEAAAAWRRQLDEQPPAAA